MARRANQGGAAGSLSVLMLADDHRSHATTLREHIDAFRRFSRHRVHTYNPRGLGRSRTLRLDAFDVVVVHYSLYVLSEAYLPAALADDLAAFDGLKVQYIQDEYRQVEETWAALRRLGIDVLFTLAPERELERVWPAAELPGLRKITTYAGFVSDAARMYRSPPLAARPLDVGYRGRELPYWLGILGQEKAWIAQNFLARASATDLRCDIGWRESDRIYGKTWFEWLTSCRATLGTESGSSIVDFDGSLQRRVEAHLRRRPTEDFWSVHEQVLAEHEGNVRLNVVSPRVFEAAALRTALVLYPGEYSGVVEPDRHYIALEKDFSNFDEVVARLRDVEGLQAIVDRTYREVACDPRFSLRALVSGFDTVVAEHGRSRTTTSSKLGYHLARLERPLTLALRPSRRRAHVIGAGTRSIDGVVRAAAAARLVAADPALLRYLPRALASVDGGRRKSLLSDLTRIALLRRAQHGRLNAGDVFVVAPTVEEDRLVLRSVAPRVGIAPVSRFSELLRGGAVESIVWDHGGVSRRFPLPLTRARWAVFDVGDDDAPAAYRFEELASLASALPRQTDELVAPLLTTPDVDPQTLAVTRRRLPLALHLLRHIDNYAPKALAAVSLLRRNRRLRTLARMAFADETLRRDFGLQTLTADLVKLALLEQARRGELVPGAYATPRFEDGALVFQTTRNGSRGDELGRLSPEQVQRLVWDHSEIGVEARGQSGPSFALGRAGVFEFTTIPTLLRRYPRATWDALTR